MTVAGSAPPAPEVSSSRRAWVYLTRSQTRTGQLLRFGAVGGSTNLVYLGLYLSLVGVGEQVANAVGVVVSTALTNELHRRLTFRASGRTSWWTAQWEGAGLAAVALVVSAGVLAAAEMALPGASPLVDGLLVVVASGLVGIGKFFVFRRVVFTRRAPG